MVRVKAFEKERGKKINWCSKCAWDRNIEKRVCPRLRSPIYDNDGNVSGFKYDMLACYTEDNSIAPSLYEPRHGRR